MTVEAETILHTVTINQLLQTAEKQCVNGLYDDAQYNLRKIIVQEPFHFSTTYNLGTLFLKKGLMERAISILLRSARIKQDNENTWICLAVAASHLSRWQAGVLAAKRALICSPMEKTALTIIGDVSDLFGKYQDAVTSFKHAFYIEEKDMFLAWRFGFALLKAGDWTAALPHLMNALTYGDLSAEQLLQTGIAFYNQGLTDQAVDYFDISLIINPLSAPTVWYKTISILPQVPASSEEISSQREAYEYAITSIEKFCGNNPSLLRDLAIFPLPFPYYLPYQGMNDRHLQDKIGQLFHKIMCHHPVLETITPHQPVRRGNRFRIGIVSAFFRLHSNWKIPIKGWMEGLDRSRFEIFVYYTDKKRDRHTEHAMRLCDQFVMGPMEFEDWVKIISEDGLDILLYPEIGMDSLTARLAALRMAPVQCSSWGHPETSGLPTIDYFLSSDLMEVDEADQYYSEKLVRLPNLSIYYDPDHLDRIDHLDRGDIGFSNSDMIYWCCQNLSKYLPEHDDVFARIALGNASAKFLFLEDKAKQKGNSIFRSRMEAAFRQVGLDWNNHCVFLPNVPQSRFLGITKIADIFLDSIGWSGCNSVMDAIALDLPVITLPGQLMRGRHASAILTMIGCTKTIAHDKEHYIDLAIYFGENDVARAVIRKIISNGKHSIYNDNDVILALNNFFHQVVGKIPPTPL